MAFAEYLDALLELVTRIRREQSAAIQRAAELVADTLAVDGLVHTFGTGHSHLLAEERFFRAGGLVAVSPVRDRRLMMLDGAIVSTHAERGHGLARSILERHVVAPGDVAIIMSIPAAMSCRSKCERGR